MRARWLAILVFASGLLFVDAASADVTVTNRAYSPIEVQVDDGAKKSLAGGQSATWKVAGAEPTVTVFHFGARKARATIKDGQKVRVVKNNNMFSIMAD